MFDDYKDSQSVVYEMIKNSVLMQKISHAYLIDSNNYSDVDNFIKAFVKLLICPYNYSNICDDCMNCLKCKRIDNGNYTEVRYIYPDGLFIKKEQLLELQSDFNLSSVEGKKLVYVIWNCEKMNVQASNSLLKFLEEPNSDITAILVTSNIDALLPTIISRCQYIKLFNNSLYLNNTIGNIERLIKESGVKFTIDEDVDKYIKDIFEFVLYFEQYRGDTLLYLKTLWHDKFGDRSNYLVNFKLIIELYYDILKYKLRSEIEFFGDYRDFVVKIDGMLEFEQVINRISIYMKYLELLKFNLNLNLLMDSLVIELGELL